jgi:putative DNA primase/helicase
MKITKQPYGLSAAVKQKAEGQWNYILRELEGSLHPALANKGRHVPCPIHGGKDGFRFFSDMEKKGHCICNTCGPFDGFKILMKLQGKEFPEVVCDIADLLGIERRVKS